MTEENKPTLGPSRLLFPRPLSECPTPPSTALLYQQIKEKMSKKGFKQFVIPNQFDDDARYDDFFEEDIWDGGRNIFKYHNHHGYISQWAIDGLFLEDQRLKFQVVVICSDDADFKGEEEERFFTDESEIQVLSSYMCNSWELDEVLKFYLSLLDRYDTETPYLEK